LRRRRQPEPHEGEQSSQAADLPASSGGGGSTRVVRVGGGTGGGGGDPKLLRVGGPYDPAPVREKTRRQLALLLAWLLAAVAVSLIACVAFNKLTDREAKDLAAAVLSPIVAVTGTALGFYFGGHASRG
jgi:hypothetical protein